MALDVQIKPEAVGFDAARLARIDRHFARYVDDGRLPGWLIALSRAASWCNCQGRPPAQVHRVLRDALRPLGLRLSAAALHKLARGIAAGQPVELP
jgi:hypothetical protein